MKTIENVRELHKSGKVVIFHNASHKLWAINM